MKVLLDHHMPHRLRIPLEKELPKNTRVFTAQNRLLNNV